MVRAKGAHEDTAERFRVISATFFTLHGATTTLAQLGDVMNRGLIDFENAAAFTRIASGRIEFLPSDALPAWHGVGGGAHIAGILGRHFPAGATRAAAHPDYATRLHDAGFEDVDLHALVEELEPGTSMLMAVIDPKWFAPVDDILNEVAAKIGWAVMNAAISDLVQQHGAAHPMVTTTPTSAQSLLSPGETAPDSLKGFVGANTIS